MVSAIAAVSLSSCGGNKQAEQVEAEEAAPKTEAVEQVVEKAEEKVEETVKKAAVGVQEACKEVTEKTQKVIEEKPAPKKVEAGVKAAAASSSVKVEMKK